MSIRPLYAQSSLLLILFGAWLLCASPASAQTLDTCEIDLDLSVEDIGECEERTDGWLRLGFPPASAGLATAGNLSGELTLTPGAANEIRIAQILPTQPAVWLARQDARATLLPDQWINVVLVRQASANSYAVSVVHWREEGLGVVGTVLATSSTFTQSGPIALSVGWGYNQGQVTVNVSAPGSTTLAATRSGFGSTLPWLSLPHFPSGHVDLGTASVGTLSGAAQ